MKGLVVSGTIVLGLLVGCSSAPPTVEATARAASPVQGGTDDTTHDFAVGVVVNLGDNEGELCSGALLAPNLVATARHCVSQMSSAQVDCATSTFGSVFAPSQFVVTNSPVIEAGATTYGVSKVIVPTGSGEDLVCGNDIALLLLSQNVDLPAYVEPVLNPPMTDHATWATTVTAIGYGEDDPLDGSSAGTRRIREDIGLVCIPDDASFVDCYADPANKSVLTTSEFESGNGTCEGDSGSSAFDQTQFDDGKWVSFGVLSRGNQASGDDSTCAGAVYSRFDAWASLIIGAATEAAQAGNYAVPSWVAGETVAASTGGGHGCTVAVRGDPTHPVPWRTASVGLAAVGLTAARRRR
jgi:secreted trypsin-like serine protease